MKHLILRATLVIVLVLGFANIMYGQSSDSVKVDTMGFVFVGPAIKGDTFVTARRVRSMLEQIGSHVDELEHGFLFLRETTQEAQQKAAILQFTVDSLKLELQRARTCKIGDSTLTYQKKK